jgi:hypothetical protein
MPVVKAADEGETVEGIWYLTVRRKTGGPAPALLRKPT